MCLDGLGREKGKEKVVAYKKIKKINKFKFKCERKNGKKKKILLGVLREWARLTKKNKRYMCKHEHKHYCKCHCL